MPYNIIAHGRYLVDQDMCATAAVVLEKAVIQYPDDFDAWVLLSNARGGLANFVQASEAADHALELIPDQLHGLCAKARALSGLQHHSQALAITDQIITNSPTLALADAVRGRILGDMGQTGPALQSLDHALSLNPSLLLALVHKNNILVDIGRKQEASTIAQQLVRMYPASLVAQALLSATYAESEDAASAAAQARSIIKQGPGEPLGWMALGDAISASGKSVFEGWHYEFGAWYVVKRLNPNASGLKAVIWKQRVAFLAGGKHPGCIGILVTPLVFPLIYINALLYSFVIARNEQSKNACVYRESGRSFYYPLARDWEVSVAR